MSEMNVEENLQYTPERAEQLLQNYRRVLERIRTAEQDHSAVRTEASAPVQLVTVTKFFPASDAAALLDGGVTLFGENRDQEASAKARELAAYCAQREVQPPHWAFIGQLQTKRRSLWSSMPPACIRWTAPPWRTRWRRRTQTSWHALKRGRRPHPRRRSRAR